MHSRTFLVSLLVAAGLAGVAGADQFQLVTGVDAGLLPGADRYLTATPGAPPFNDGDRLAGTLPAGPAATFQGTGTPLINPNQYGALSFAFTRGSIPSFAPFMSVDFLGGPLIDLDGDTGNGSRSLTPVPGQTPVLMSGTSSYVDLGINAGGGTVTLNYFDASGSNAAAPGISADFAVTVNTLAGTSATGAAGSAINPSIDTRQGTLTPIASGISRIQNLGYEFWQDPISGNASGPDDLGYHQFLGSLNGWLIERDPGTGDFPTLAGLLGTTAWPAVDTSLVGNTFNSANGTASTATIASGLYGDDFTAAGNGGLPLTDFSGDLGAYLDSVVIPNVDPLSQSFVYLESPGFGIANSPTDPIFGDTVGYDMVLVAQSMPVPEPGMAGFLLLGTLAILRRRRWT